jgi:hypothetical protein
MGFLDKLLGRKKNEADEGLQTAPPPATMPESDSHEHSPGETEHGHEHEEEPRGTSS